MADIKQIGFLFDLDGVIIDSEKEYSRIWGYIDSKYHSGVENFTTNIKGTTLENILDSYFNRDGVKEKVINELIQLEQQMVYEYCPGAKELLEKIKREGYPIALNTSSNEKKMQHLREQMPELFGYFDKIVTGDRISRSKPDPESYILAANEIDTDPTRCAIFEDSLQGVMAGKNAGGFVVGVVGTLPGEVLSPYSDMLVESLEDVDLQKIISVLSSNLQILNIQT